ncbi:hypothetical protein GIB67_039647 [Kingdonia uniflora]|uniref:Uncharacterized protein n=1 Tax=Kingdonia uniflora TaxID=39325 RepID=A0A7J7MDS2_9MAGN|nr:hypothetical protein GIB67_039647 [Kingdonia uniflora]
MKFDKEVNEQVDEENQTQKGGAKKGTSNTKSYTSRCTSLGLHKIFAALSEEKKDALHVTCFTPLLLIDPIATISMLVAKIFNLHLGDMKFQFGETIIHMIHIHVYLILGICVSPIANEFLFVDPEHMTNFRIRQFPKKKNIYGLKEIDVALKQAKLEKHQEDVLRLNLLKIILSFLLPNKGRNVWVNLKFPRIEESIHLFPKLQGWRMTSFKCRQIATFLSILSLKFPRIEESIYLFPKLQGWGMTSFKRHQIVTFKKFFANPKLLVLAMKPSVTDMQQGLVQVAMRNQIEAPAIDAAPAVSAPAIGSSSSAT